MQASQGRDIMDDTVIDDNGVMSYMDLQIAEQTFGKKLCKDCLKKYLNNMNKQ